MRESFRIISKAIFLVCFAIFLSFMVKTEAKADVIDKLSSPSKPELTNLINVESNGSGPTRTYTVSLTSNSAIIDGLGYRFLNWQYNDVELMDDGGVVGLVLKNPGDNASVTAVFETAYPITLDKGVHVDSVYSPQDIYQASGATVTISADVTDTDYEFDQWTTASEGVTFANASSSQTTFTMPDHAVTVTATAKQRGTYRITFDSNNGSSSTSTVMTGTDGKLASLPAYPGWTGHNCTGWFTQATGGDPVTTNTVFTANTTIFAHWENATAAPSITTTSLPNGTVGEAYSQQLEASGGSGALSWEITSGTPLPPPFVS